MTIKKIFLVSTLLSGKGGMETVIKDFCAGMKLEGVEVEIFLLGRVKARKHNLNWLSSLNHKILYPSRFTPSFLRKTLETRKLAQLINQKKPDACIGLNFGALERLNSARKFTHYFKVISWLHFSLKTFHNLEVIKKADCHLAISSGIASELRDLLNIPPENIATIYNPLPYEAPVNCLPRPRDGKSVFLFVGRLASQKNPMLLINAFSKLEGDWLLHIVGDGGLRTALQDKVKQNGIENKVIFHGWKEDCWGYISTLGPISALVLSSDNEGLPMALLEGTARGVFCIAANCETGPADIITTNNGVLFPPGDEKALLTELETVVAQKGVPPVPSEVIRKTVEKFSLRKYCHNVLKSLNAWNLS